MMQTVLENLIGEATGAGLNFTVAAPTDLAHGDYTTNAALILAQQTGERPRAVAESIVAKLQNTEHPMLSKIEVAGPGFINFFLTPEFFARQLAEIIGQGERWGSKQTLAGQKVLVEYTDPNPFKEFHIGHLMSNAIGESLSRLIEFSGAEVKRACYQGDVGLHVAKAVWAKLEVKSQKAKEWGEVYALGAQAYEGGEEAKKEIEIINKKIYDRSDHEVNKLYEQGKKESLAGFEKVYRQLGTKFDFYFFESETGTVGRKLVEANIGKVFEKSEAAVVFRGEQQGLHTRVFITKDGLPTYEAKELGLTKIKNEKWPHDVSVVVTGNEIKEYFKVVLAALGQIEPAAAAKIKHVPHGMLRLPTGKMSSRTGEIISALSLIEEVRNRVTEQMGQEQDALIAEQIAVAAIKYAILKQAPGRDVVFDPLKSISLTGDSGPYLQYSAVRANSVLAKSNQTPDPSQLLETHALARALIHFPEVVERARREFAPQLLLAYLTGLAAAFNSFYAREKIIGSAGELGRLAVVSATVQTLKNGLRLLGMAVPERM